MYIVQCTYNVLVTHRTIVNELRNYELKIVHDFHPFAYVHFTASHTHTHTLENTIHFAICIILYAEKPLALWSEVWYVYLDYLERQDERIRAQRKLPTSAARSQCLSTSLKMRDEFFAIPTIEHWMAPLGPNIYIYIYEFSLDIFSIRLNFENAEKRFGVIVVQWFRRATAISMSPWV